MIFRKKQAFTLVETLSAVVTFGIVAAMMHALFIGAWINFEIGLTNVELAQEANKIFSIIEEDVLESKNVELSGGDLIVNFPIPQMDVNNPGTPILGDAVTGNFPENQVEYQFANQVGTLNLELTRVGITSVTSTLLSRRIDVATSFIIDGDINAGSGRSLEVKLFLRDDVFGSEVFYQQSKEMTARNPV